MTHLVHQYVSRSAGLYPDSIAVSCKQQALTYSELDSLTNGYARDLVELGLQRGNFVCTFLKKSVNAIVALQSILKADCAYVPLDTASPAERIQSIMSDSDASMVLVDDATEDALQMLLNDSSVDVPIVNIERLPASDRRPREHQNISIDIAYVLFTSGSTGAPKGVMISHQMILDYIAWCVDIYQLSHTDRIANHAPLYFDNSTFDIYTAFASGAQLHLVHDALNQIMPKLLGWLEEREITVFFCVPSVLSILQRSGKVRAEGLTSLRHVIAAGEVLPTDVVAFWQTTLPATQMTNMYGPTEITVDCTYHFIATNHTDCDVPIGKARRNMEVFVRTAEGLLSSEPGAEGEIAVRGLSVSYGYLNNAEKTSQVFIQNPRHALYHDPVYLTGDYARIAKDGVFHYLGRRDQQIKFMGHRIELGEIESSLRAIAGVVEASVVFHDAEVMKDKFIGAAVVLDSRSLQEVSKESKSRLPSYMAPRHMIEIAEMPRTPNGKTDRKAILELFEAKL